MLLQAGNILFEIGAVMGIGGVALGVLSYWGIVLSAGSRPKPVLYFINKCWWVLLVAGIFVGVFGYELHEIAKGTFEFDWFVLVVPFAFAAFMFVGYIIVREALAEIKGMLGKKLA